MTAPATIQRGVLAAPDTMERAAQADTLIFDIDGVLVDVSRSLIVVISEAVEFYLTRILGWKSAGRYTTTRDVNSFKAAGGFNDDWDLACALTLLFLVKAHRNGSTEAAVLRRLRPTAAQVTRELRRSRAGYPGLQRLLLDSMNPADAEEVRRLWDTDTIKQIYKEHFAGPRFCRRMYGFDPQHYFGRAYVLEDRAIVRTDLLRRRPWKLGLYTGRTLGETEAALELMGAEDLFPRDAVVTADDHMLKPDPQGLELIVERLRSELAIFCGDMPDDMEAARRYAAGRSDSQPAIIYCHVRGGRRGSAWPGEADIVVPGVNHLLKALSG